MSEKKDKKRKTSGGENKKAEDKTVETVDQEKAKKLKEDMDRLIDEIDDIIKEEGQEFIKSYIQKGGE